MSPPDQHSDSHLPPNSPKPDALPDDFASVPHLDFDQWVDTLQESDRSFYNLMAMEVWSIAKTMDDLLPGFWSRFMSHRQIALKQFMQQKHPATSDEHEPPPSPDA